MQIPCPECAACIFAHQTLRKFKTELPEATQYVRQAQ